MPLPTDQEDALIATEVAINDYTDQVNTRLDEKLESESLVTTLNRLQAAFDTGTVTLGGTPSSSVPTSP